MALNDLKWPFCIKICSDKTVRKVEELPIHCQRQDCSPGNLVSSNVRFIWIFMGVCGRGGVIWVWGVINGDFRFFHSLYLPNLHIHGHNYYIVLCSPLVALHWHQNGWPCMTLNGHFALKSGSSSTSNGLAFLALGENCSEICRATQYTHRLSVAKKCSPPSVLVI